MKIYLVRHGETPYNSEGRLQGRIDIPLNEQGEAQAEALGSRFQDEVVKSGEHFSAIYASPLTRTLQTAAPVAKALNLSPAREEGLIELDMGEWEGKTPKEIALYKDGSGAALFQKCYKDPLHNPMPGGETLPAMDSRVTSALNRIITSALPLENVVCVTHGGAIAIALCHVLGKSLQEVPLHMVKNSSVTVIEADGDLDHARLITRDDVSHLKDVPSMPAKKQ